MPGRVGRKEHHKWRLPHCAFSAMFCSPTRSGNHRFLRKLRDCRSAPMLSPRLLLARRLVVQALQSRARKTAKSCSTLHKQEIGYSETKPNCKDLDPPVSCTSAPDSLTRGARLQI